MKKEDILLKKENFEDKSWYNQFRIFLAIGVCEVTKDNLDEIKDALNQMGYDKLETIEKDNVMYLAGD